MAKNKVVKKVKGKQSKELTTTQLGMMLNTNYQNLIAAQQNIQQINLELNRRQMLKPNNE